MRRAHREFTRSERKHAQAKHEQFKRNQPAMFQEQRNSFIKAILEAPEVNLNVGKIVLSA